MPNLRQTAGTTRPKSPARVSLTAIADRTRRRWMTRLVGVTLLLAGLSFTAQFAIQSGTRRPNLNRVLSPLVLGNEANVPTWFAGALLLTAAACAWLVATARDGTDPNDRGWTTLAMLLVAMSADEVGRVHETLNVVGEQVVSELGWEAVGVLRYPWVLPGAVLALVVAAWFVPLLLQLPRADQARLLLAGGLFLGGALGLEVVAASQDGSTPLVVRIGVQNLEEVLEMLGVIVLIDALLRLHATAVGVEEDTDSRPAPAPALARS